MSIKLDVNAISFNPDYQRHGTDSMAFKKEIEELALNIRGVGLLNPIIVVETGKGKYFCLAGNRRLAAVKFLKEKKIDATVVDASTREGTFAITFSENLQRRDLTPLEKGEWLTCYFEALKNTPAYKETPISEVVESLSVKLGCSPRTIYHNMQIYKTTNDDQKAKIRSGELGYVESLKSPTRQKRKVGRGMQVQNAGKKFRTHAAAVVEAVSFIAKNPEEYAGDKMFMADFKRLAKALEILAKKL